MLNTDWRDTLVDVDATLYQATRLMDSNGKQLAVAIDGNGRLCGIITDGDVRRAILAGKNMSTPVAQVFNTKPRTARLPITRSAAVALMKEHGIAHLPLLDSGGRLAGIELLRESEMIAPEIWAVVMAGGLGKRLAPLTDNMPKPLLPVGGKPMLETIVSALVKNGITRIFLSINYLGEMIKAHFGDGSRWGARITYLEETEPRGTAGALALLPETPHGPMLVMNGDILTSLDFRALVEYHQSQALPATMCVREQKVQIQYGVVRFDGPYVSDIEEKPYHSCFINAGIYVLTAEAIKKVPKDGYFDMPMLFKSLVASGNRPGVFPMREFWLDIGSPADYKRAQREIATLQNADLDQEIGSNDTSKVVQAQSLRQA